MVCCRFGGVLCLEVVEGGFLCDSGEIFNWLCGLWCWFVVVKEWSFFCERDWSRVGGNCELFGWLMVLRSRMVDNWKWFVMEWKDYLWFCWSCRLWLFLFVWRISICICLDCFLEFCSVVLFSEEVCWLVISLFDIKSVRYLSMGWSFCGDYLWIFCGNLF